MSITVFFSVIWMIQHVLSAAAGGRDTLIIDYGIYFQALREWQVWRLLTGSFIHANGGHILGNYGLFMVVMPIALGLLKHRMIAWTLLASLMLAPVVQMAFGVGFDGYTGLSAGAFSLCGLIWVLSVMEPRGFPSGFIYPLSAFISGSLLLGGAVNPLSADIAHVFGLTLGVVVGYLWSRTAGGLKTHLLACDH